MKRCTLKLTVAGLVFWTTLIQAHSQQLDLDFLGDKRQGKSVQPQFQTLPGQTLPAVAYPPSGNSGPAYSGPNNSNPTSSSPSMGKSLTASVSKTLYLPPAMYGQWTVTGTVKETNISNLIPVANDIWVLQREGDAVTVTNPVNGASASIQVDAVEGNTATFHRTGQTPKVNRSETVTLTVNGNYLYGRNMRREEVIRKGQVVKVNYALFELQGVRIGGTSAVFRPETFGAGPDIEIDDVRRQ